MKLKLLKHILYIFIFFCFSVSCSESNLIEITEKESYNFEVEKTEIPRGVLVINNKYFLSNNLEIIKGIDKLGVNDESIWRLKKPLPSILNIPTPYKLFKKENNDSIFIISDRDTIIVKIKHSR